MPKTHPLPCIVVAILVTLFVTPLTASARAPIALWHADGNTLDSVGANDGQPGGALTYVNGVSGDAFDFNGVDALVRVPSSATVDVGTHDFSVVLWARPAGTGGVQTLVEKRTGNAEYLIDLNLFNSSKIRSAIVDPPNNAIQIFSSSLVNDGDWHHIGMVRHSDGGDSLALYVDGVLEAFGTYPIPLNTSSIEDLFFGVGRRSSADPTHDRFFHGALDEIALFDCALSATEVEAIHQTGVMNGCIPPPISVEIDIKPGSTSNPVSVSASGVIPVAVLTDASFDATEMDPASLAFGPGEAPESHGTVHIEDVDDDGDLDAVLHFSVAASAIHCGETSATLSGLLLNGQTFSGSDAVRTIGCR